MRFLMLFLRLVLCAVCLFALCPSAPQADGSDTPDSLPLLAQERIQERDSCLLAAPGAAFSAPAQAKSQYSELEPVMNSLSGGNFIGKSSSSMSPPTDGAECDCMANTIIEP